MAALLGFGAVAMLDRALYGRWVLVPLEFFKFNVLGGGSSQYGSKPVLWNYYQARTLVFTRLQLSLSEAPLSPCLSVHISLTTAYEKQHGDPVQNE